MTPDVPQPDQPLVNIVGEKVSLGPLRRDILPLYLKWSNDFDVMRTLGPGRPMTQEAANAWYERAAKGERDVAFVVYERSTMRPIGYTSLNRIDHAYRTAEFGIVIGEKECWGKGYGTETTKLMLDYAFSGLGLHNVMLGVLSTNERAIRAYTRAGFKVFGRQREAIWLGGRAYASVYMDCLSSEFEGSALQRLVPGS